MPALTAIITGNARQLNQELDKSLRTAEKWAKDMKRGMGGGGEYASVLTQGDVKKALEGVGEAAHGAHIPVRGLSHLFSELGVKGSGATSIIVHAFKNPIFLAIAAAAGALWLFNKALQALGPVADTLGTKSLAPQMEHFREKTIEARASMLEWAASLSKGRSEADKLNDSLAALANTTESWAAADNKVAEAKKELDLAQVKQLERQGKITKQEAKARTDAIENKFDQDKLKKANDTRNTITHSLFEAADKADAKAKEAKSSVPGLNDSYLDAQGKADANAERIKNAEENLKLLREKRKKLGASGFAGMNGNADVKINQGILDSATGAQPELLAGAKGAKSKLDEAEKSALKLREDADTKRRDADMKMTKSAAEYKSDKDVAALKAQRRAIDEDTPAKSSSRIVHGHLTGLQQAGAYSSPAGNVMIDTAKKSEHHLRQIVSLLSKTGAAGGRPMGHVQY